MKTCKVKPDKATCNACIDTQMMCDVVDDCSTCNLNTKIYEFMHVGSGIFNGDYAYVLYNGKITKVSLDRVYDVKEVEMNEHK